MSDAEKIIGIYRKWVGEWEEVNADMRRQCLTPIGREALTYRQGSACNGRGDAGRPNRRVEPHARMLNIQSEDFIASVVAA